MASKSIRRAQIPVRGTGKDKCPDHQYKVLFLCLQDSCCGQLICSKCKESTHHGHETENIVVAASKKKEKIKNYVKKTEKTTLPRIKKKIALIDMEVKEISKQNETVINKIKAHGESFKTEIDRITKELIHKCERNEKQNRSLLSRYKDELESIQTQIIYLVDNCKATIGSGNDITVIDIEKEIQKEVDQPTAPHIKDMEFTKERCPINELEDGMGVLSYKTREGMEKVVSIGSEVLHEFNYVSESSITSVETCSQESIWVASSGERFISLINLKGEVEQKVECSSSVWDISSSPVTGNLWVCCNDRTVHEVTGKTTTKRFTTDSDFRPYTLCKTSDNVVLGSKNNIAVYSSEGKALFNISDHILHMKATQALKATTEEILYVTKGPGKPVVINPQHFSVCPITGDIAMRDWDSSVAGGEGISHVTVFNSELDLKYQYFGPSASEDKCLMKSDFNPYDVAYDCQGHLLIADFNNRCIHLVSSEGRFCTMVHTDVLQPTALTLLQDGIICVGFRDKTMKVIEYYV